MVVFVVSLLLADGQGHRVLHTSPPQAAPEALATFNTLAGTRFAADWFAQATSGHVLPFVFAAQPTRLVLVTAHQG